VAAKVFMALSDKSLPVEVRTVYEIDGAADAVTFLGFVSSTPDDHDHTGTRDQAREW
jgi:hypothetical protein